MVADLGRSVGKLRCAKADGWYSCTAFRVGTQHVLTNNHCIPAASALRHATVTFGMDTIDAGTEVAVASFVAGSGTLDYSLLELETAPATMVPAVAMDAAAIPTPSASLVVIGHPQGRPLEVALATCAAAGAPIDEDAYVFEHYCDTELGSSGSPVFDATSKRLVGDPPHRLRGFVGRATRGNEATPLNRLADHLRTRIPASLYAALFSLAPARGTQ